MIAACPECRTQYRVDAEQLSEEGVRLRCTRCQTIFRVRAPRAAPAARPAAAVPAPAPAPPEPVAAPAPAAAPPPAAPEGDGPTPLSERLVLVATPDAEKAKEWMDSLRGWGLEAESAHDGVEAILKIHRSWPSAVVLDPQLPKMFGFQVCEVIKRNDSLRRIGVVLIGAIHHADRYRRAPAELYGADAYVEEPDLPDALAPLLRDLGLPIGPLPARPRPAPPAPAFEEPAAVTLPPPVPPEATLPPSPPVALMPEPVAPPPVPADEVTPPAPDVTFPPALPVAEPAPQAMEAPAPLPSMPEPAPFVAEPEPAMPAAGILEPASGPRIGSAEYDVMDPDVSAPAARPAPPVQAYAEPMAPAPLAPPAPAPVAAKPAPDPEVEQAERLARIIISDVVLYNEDKFRAACKAGNVLEALEQDLADGRAHFASRVPEHVRNARDFLADELVRLAHQRGMV